ncbi:hypothetical protein FQN57_003905 [Myotisia sp. PD_48]|nr:hypothetical protein FQN57_003905 [Myotisia sp. PD_48]
MATAEEAIGAFIAFTSASREQAVKFLTASNFDSNRAINTYFENSGGLVTEVSLRVPATDSSTKHSFTDINSRKSDHKGTRRCSKTITVIKASSPRILAMEHHLARPRESGPVNRMKEYLTIKRLSYQQTQVSVCILSGLHFGIWLTDSIVIAGSNMSLEEREEQEIQQAMAMSLYRDFETDKQESGVMPLAGAHFGPANREYYDERAWSMTVHGSPVREVCLDPDPKQRRRKLGEPAFLGPCTEAVYLAGLLTILHAIPLARQQLLSRVKPLSNYGRNRLWWTGDQIRIGLDQVDLETRSSTDKNFYSALYEIQRLMAFLDGTDRAFGSADGLANMQALGGLPREQILEAFFRLLEDSPSLVGTNPAQNTFFSTGVKHSSSEDECASQDFAILELTVDDTIAGKSLYDAFDDHIWADMPGRDLQDVWLSHVAHVFTICLQNPTNSERLDLKIPPVWYPDRYMDSCKSIATEIRLGRLKVQSELNKIHALMDRFSNTELSSHSVVSFESMIEKVEAGSQVALHDQYTVGLPEAEISSEKQPVSSESIQELVKQLKQISEKITRKAKELEGRRLQALESLKDLSTNLTTPSSNPDEPPSQKYTLRGVCTLPHVLYVLRRNEHDYNQMADESVDSQHVSDEWQWWRISFSVEDANIETQLPAVPSSIGASGTEDASIKRSRANISPNTDLLGYSIRPVREVEVLRAAKEESSTALLVYASEDAVNFVGDALPESLQKFVNMDNNLFQTEIQLFEPEVENLKADQVMDTTGDGADVEVSNLPDEMGSEPTSTDRELNTSEILLDQEEGLPKNSMEIGAPTGNISEKPEPIKEQEMQEMQETGAHGLLPSARQRLSTRRSGTMGQIKEESEGETGGRMVIDTDQRSAPAA